MTGGGLSSLADSADGEWDPSPLAGSHLCCQAPVAGIEKGLKPQLIGSDRSTTALTAARDSSEHVEKVGARAAPEKNVSLPALKL